MIVYLLCFILFLVGLFGVLTKRNVIKIVIGLSVMEFSLFLFFALIGYIDKGIAPIIVQNIPMQNLLIHYRRQWC
jgi:multicomponent Na+:H+ antiporter subunit C